MDQVAYIYAPHSRVEVILCRDSAISYPVHTHVSARAAGMILSGSVTLTIGGVSRICGQGQSFLIPPHIPHKIEAAAPYSLLTLCVRGDAPDSLPQAFSTLSRLRGLEDQLVRLFVLAAAHQGRPPLPPAIGPAEAWLERFPETELRVDALARSVYMSEAHFIRCFRQAVGLTPHRFQIQNRVRKAQRLLDGPGGVTEAALASGFYDQSHLTRHFKRLVGLTPAAYRASRVVLPPLR